VPDETRRGLTERQQEVLEFLTDTLAQGGGPPTLREVAAHFGWASDNAARQHLRLMRQKGVISYDEVVARGIRLAPGRGARARTSSTRTRGRSSRAGRSRASWSATGLP